MLVNMTEICTRTRVQRRVDLGVSISIRKRSGIRCSG
jgi:hypothetical protein